MGTLSFANLGILFYLAATGLLLLSRTDVLAVTASPTVIEDERVRSLSVTPALGRGYSLLTNTFHSICLDVETPTEGTYNYDYFVEDIRVNENNDYTLSPKLGSSFGSDFIKAELSASKNDKNSSSQEHKIVASMRIDRYYSSVDENKANFRKGVLDIIEDKDYVSFFKACGPMFVRSIRRAQEVTAMFTFKTSDESIVRDMEAAIKATIYGSAEAKMSSNVQNTMKTLEIKIVAFGLGLDDEGSETLVATNLQQFNGVMKFAFNSMTRGNDASAQTGMVYGMEVVPWTENTIFLSAAEFKTDSLLSWPLGRELIPNKPCSEGLVEDDVDKCCKEGVDMRVYEKVDSEGGIRKTRVCQPLRPYPFELMKHNMMTNAEFVAQMDFALRRKMNIASTLQTCVSQLKGFPSRYDNYFLKTSDTVADSNTKELGLTVKELRDALDPDGSMTSVKLVHWELDEFVEMFYSPCLTALHGLNTAATNSKPASLDMKMDHFMLQPYYSLPQCQHLACLFDNARWDRASENGGCKSGLLMGINEELDKDIQVGENYAKSFNLDTHEVEPKTSGEMIWNKWIFPKNQKRTIGKCWGNPAFSPAALMDQYCLPRISNIQTEQGESTITSCWSDIEDDV